MSLTKEKKNELIGKYGRAEGDTGSAEVQVALLTCASTAKTTTRAAAC
jgi:small subunit ribosomal protein S15